MCGIGGIMRPGGQSPDAKALSRMADAMRHRGPDSSGVYMRGNAGLIHTRLAIIDLATGQHPLYEPLGAAIVGNGEIYNYIELAKELAGAGVALATNSDFEPALHLYRRLGTAFTKRLRGMYAIAIHDPDAAKLVLARDPFGIKPLYYTIDDGVFAFASEVAALRAAGFAGAPANPAAYAELLQLQFLTGDRTATPGVFRLLPGEILVVEDGQITGRHRDIALPQALKPEAMDEEEALARLDAELRESVDLHQRSDVPYGLFFSGGIDSSAILAVMARLNSRPVRTFTIGFRDKSVANETALAKRLSVELATDHTEVDFSEADFWELLPRVAAVLDEPAADYACLPTFKLASVAASSVKVVLSGEGGDEFFGGYGWYRRALRPRFLGGNSPVRHRTGKFDGLSILAPETSHWRDGIAANERREAQRGRTRLQVAQAADIADWLPNDLLTKLDRCLMAHSLEGRVPFVDLKLGAFAFQLPDRLKFSGRLGKYLLRLWLARNLPSAQPFARKRGFTVPVNRWIGAQAGRVGDLVARQQGVAQVCDPEAVRRLFAQTGDETRMARWALLFFACWHQSHVSGVTGACDAFEHLDAV